MSYNFADLYGQADFSGGVLVDKGTYDAIVTKAEFGQSKGGDKDQWTVETTITTGQFAGSKLTNNLTISPVKQDGERNEKGLGILYRHLRCLGVPVEVPGMPPLPQGTRNFWEMGWDGNMAARAMLGRPVQIQVIHDEYEGSPRAKVRDYREARPGSPTEVQRPQVPAATGGPGYGQPNGAFGPGGDGGYAQGGPAQGGPGYAQGGGGGGGYDPGYAGQQQDGYGQFAGQVAPGPWQNAQQTPQGQGWNQQPQPGAGGPGEYAAQGPGYQGYPPQGAFNQGGYQQGAPAPAQGYGQPGYPPPQGQPQQGYGAPAVAAPGQGAPPQQGAPSPSSAPPWAQQGQPQQPQQGQQPPQGQQDQGAPPRPWEQ